MVHQRSAFLVWKRFGVAEGVTNAGSRRVVLAVLSACLWAAARAPVSQAQTEAQSNRHELTVKVTGLRNNKGVVGVALFSNPTGFPESSDKALQAKNAEIKDGSAEVVFPNLAPGPYAVSVRHDENSNGKLDKNVLGIPKEGYGASNNPHPKRRGPKFEEAKFELSGPAQTIEIKVQY
jgi:uncharacterized protein (DUF2141 family)